MEPVLQIADESSRNRYSYISKELLRLADAKKALRIESASQTRLILSESLLLKEYELNKIFDILNLKREDNLPKDIHGRFDQNNLKWDVEHPEVDEYICNIKKHLDIPKKGCFKVFFTHDIDWVTGLEPVSMFKSIKSSFSGSKWLSLPEVFDKNVFVRNYKEMLKIEEKYNVRTWNFMLADSYGIGRYSSRYGIKWKTSGEIVESILESGNEIGLHGSYFAGDMDSYKEEAENLGTVSGKKIISHRNHYLRFKPDKVWDQLDKAGIKYDFSVGYSDRMGFRSGISTSYFPYNPLNSSVSNVKAIPLIFMEREHYLLDENNSISRLKLLLENVKAQDGSVSILFHPESLVINKRWISFYDKTLKLVVEMGADVSGKLSDISGQ